MAVHIYCSGCRGSYKVDVKTCPKCEAPFKKKKYRVCVSVKGKRVTRFFDNLTLAREAEAAIKADILRGDLKFKEKAKPAPTLAEVWAKYLPWAKEHKKSWIDDQRNYRKHLEPWFGNKRLDSISSLDVERMKLELKKGISKRGKPYTMATIRHQLTLLNRLYNLAKRWGLYKGDNPLDRVEFPRLDNLKTEFLSDEEADRLMTTLDSWPCRESAAFVKFALFTGLRRGELFKLTWDDVDFNRGLITIRSPKGGKTQTLPISPQALEVLRSLEVRSPYVFPGKNGRQRTDFKGPWVRIRQAAGLPGNFRFHGLRHHFASTLVSHGVDLSIVQALLTHKDARTTQRYSHLKPGAMREAALKSGELLTPQVRTEKQTKALE